jgi:hypothetical protein
MVPVMPRRAVLRALAGGAALALPRPARARPRDAAQTLFRASRDGSEIGWHRLAFRTDGERLVVDIEISFEVSFAFLTLYRYHHRSRETWRGPRLVALDTTTDDDGERYAVRAQAAGDRLRVATAAGETVELPADVLPTSYWHESTVARSQWLDTQKGRLLRAEVERQGQDEILAGGRRVRATRYRLQGDLDCELWYHEQRWSKLRFRASDGSTIDYQLAAGARNAG